MSEMDSDSWLVGFDATGNVLAGEDPAAGDPSTEGGAGADSGERGSAMRVVFMGTPEFALGSLRALDRAEKVDVAAVVTRPDAVSGRGRTPQPSPVKRYALQAGIPVIETKTLRTPEVQDEIRALAPDVIAVTAYGAIIPDEVLRMPTMGCVNVHASLLPRWRGAAPIQRAILAGDPLVGFSIMKVGHELDAGPWCEQSGFAPGEHTFDEVSARLSVMGGDTLADVLVRWWEGDAPSWNVQDPDRATYAEKVSKAEMRLNPADGVVANARRVFASSNAAPARCVVAGRGVRVTRAHVPQGGEDAPELGAGEAAAVDGRLFLGCSEPADGSPADAPASLEVLEVRPDGGREMGAAAFVAGIHDRSDMTWEALA